MVLVVVDRLLVMLDVVLVKLEVVLVVVVERASNSSIGAVEADG